MHVLTLVVDIRYCMYIDILYCTFIRGKQVSCNVKKMSTLMLFYLVYLPGTWRCKKLILLPFKGLYPSTHTHQKWPPPMV